MIAEEVDISGIGVWYLLHFRILFFFGSQQKLLIDGFQPPDRFLGQYAISYTLLHHLLHWPLYVVRPCPFVCTSGNIPLCPIERLY